MPIRLKKSVHLFDELGRLIASLLHSVLANFRSPQLKHCVSPKTSPLASLPIVVAVFSAIGKCSLTPGCRAENRREIRILGGGNSKVLRNGLRSHEHKLAVGQQQQTLRKEEAPQKSDSRRRCQTGRNSARLSPLSDPQRP